MDVALLIWGQKPPVRNLLVLLSLQHDLMDLGLRFLVSLNQAKVSYSLGSISFCLCKNSTLSFISSLLITFMHLSIYNQALALLLKTLHLTPILFQQVPHFSAPFNTKMSEKSHPHWLIVYSLTSPTISSCCWIASISIQPLVLPTIPVWPLWRSPMTLPWALGSIPCCGPLPPSLLDLCDSSGFLLTSGLLYFNPLCIFLYLTSESPFFCF